MATNDPILLLTRPLAQSRRFAQDLSEGGAEIETIISPVMDIRCSGAAPDLQAYSGVIFTSENGVRCAAAPADRRVPAYCVGPRTAQAAQDAGFAAHEFGPDAEALVAAILQAGTPGPLLHLRGKHARGAVAKRLESAGLQCAERVLYDQVARDPSLAALTALAGERPLVVPLFSPRSARLFGQVAADGRAPLCLVTMSAAVDEAWCGPDPVLRKRAERPDGDAMTKSTLALIAAARHLEGKGHAG